MKAPRKLQFLIIPVEYQTTNIFMNDLLLEAYTIILHNPMSTEAAGSSSFGLPPDASMIK